MPEDGFVFPGEITWDDIQTEVFALCQEVLMPYTEVVRIQKEERIADYVVNNAPEYRYILKSHPEKMDDIAPNISEDKLDVALYEIHKQNEISLKKEANELLDDDLEIDDEITYEEQWEKFSKFWSEWNEVGKANLAKYIVHRKLMLAFLERALRLQDSGKYAREDAIHQIIFPLRTTSDDITYSQHNLWIIDEKLAYHQYLASDMPLSKVDPLESNLRLRPDLLVFNHAIAVVDDESPYNSGIVIFEFKRPMRDDYSANENPIQQVLRYVEEIKSGNAKDKHGRPINIPLSTPFYCYIVCDVTKKLKEQARYSGLRSTPDASGYFGYNDEVGAYIEVIDFEKLLRDAKKRNRVLFEKLNLPNRVDFSESIE